ncbi:MAG: L-serine ammonia-lyase, iron-sulfur-dependent, subunit alpha [Phycisphaerae bacterium]|nr:L-serine ammonia-lyase, iron-sulfur-dependent, subunit alpha [Phycisphaerae bacterium]
MKMTNLPGILNDVIGPVMRGPSSSHTAASWRIGRTGLDILNDPLEKALVEFDRQGAWAPNYREQGTTMGIEGGLLGLEMTDERMKDTEGYARQKGITIDYQISAFPTDHTNTVRLTLWGSTQRSVQIIAVSLGGGSFEIRCIDGFGVKIKGDWYELLLFAKEKTDISEALKTILPEGMTCVAAQDGTRYMYECKSSHPFSPELIAQLKHHSDIENIAVINPIMPVISGRQKEMPFTTVQSLIAYAEQTGSSLGDLGLVYETCISGLTDQEVIDKMTSLAHIIDASIATGLKGTQYKDRILPQQSHLIEQAEKAGTIKHSVVNRIIANVSALMESKSAMEVIVAIPTAGSCGTVGGSFRAIAEDLGSSKDDLVKAYFAAGLVGAYFAQGPGFSAEEHGCQVECGAAAGMAGAGIVQLMGGTAKQALDAASMAIQNMIGLVCDPVADRVEVPCLGKNISAGVNAFSSAIMAMSGFDAVIPLDQVVQTVSRVSRSMPTCVKCTGKGGLAITETAVQLKLKLSGLSN